MFSSRIFYANQFILQKYTVTTSGLSVCKYQRETTLLFTEFSQEIILAPLALALNEVTILNKFEYRTLKKNT